MAKAKFNHVEIKPIKNSRLIALEIWILIFYKYKKLDDIINNSYDFNRLEKAIAAGDSSWSTAIDIAVNLYLDIINLFIDLLIILAESE